jgi:predicted O-methyltransferase YrrM
MTNEDTTTKLLRDVDAYIERLFVPADEALEAALRDSREAGLPPINVSATQGRLLQLLVEISGAESVLEIGTLGGYSSIWFMRSLMSPRRFLMTLELDPHHAEVARKNIKRAGISEEEFEIMVGDAHDSLDILVAEESGPFDLIFIDADKESYPDYLEQAMKLSRPGTLILADNALRGVSVLDPDGDSPRATREFNERIAHDERLSAIVLPLIRDRVDGIAIAKVL